MDYHALYEKTINNVNRANIMRNIEDIANLLVNPHGYKIELLDTYVATINENNALTLFVRITRLDGKTISFDDISFIICRLLKKIINTHDEIYMFDEQYFPAFTFPSQNVERLIIKDGDRCVLKNTKVMCPAFKTSVDIHFETIIDTINYAALISELQAIKSLETNTP
jgi:hypothetical protein